MSFFIAMRLVQGDVGSLVAPDSPLPAGRAALIISAVASALDAAHERGLVHRDVKPANILLDTRPGRPDQVYLSDFGISKAMAESSVLTQSGQFLGTIVYAAPEQFGDRPIDGRADQYALGCVAYELLSGAPPFRRNELPALIHAHLSEPPPSLSQLRPGLPTTVDEVFATVLAKDPADRYASCGRFAAALGSALGLPGPDAYADGARSRAHPPTESPATISQVSGEARTDQPSAPMGAQDLMPGQPPVGGHDLKPPPRGPWRRRSVLLGAAGLAIALAIAGGVVLANGGTAHPRSSGESRSSGLVSGWHVTGAMVSPHADGAMTAMADGRILAVSGDNGSAATPVSEVFDPADGRWTRSGDVNQPREAFGIAALDNGDVLIAGGTDRIASTDYASAELYNSRTGKWGYTGSLNTPRRYAVMIKLKNGEVLDATGAHGPPDGNRFLFTAELYDPQTGRWSYTGNMDIGRDSGYSVLLHDGRVLVLGGEGPWLTLSPQTDLYNPATDTWSLTGNLAHGVSQTTLIVLSDGRVLMAGGASRTGKIYADAEIYNPASGLWTPTGSMDYPRAGAAAALLPDGRVLVSGGNDNGKPVLTSDIYNPATGRWTPGPTMQINLSGGRMIQLDDGNILMASGDDASGPATAAEIYHPSATPQTEVSPPLSTSASPSGGSLQVPKITSVGTYQKGALVYFDIHYSDPGHDAQGFGFVGVNGSGWAEENHPFSNPSYGIVGPDSVAYPFNEGCGTAQQYASYVKTWIYDKAGDRSTPLVIHLVCAG